jgi:hypothetical protein
MKIEYVKKTFGTASLKLIEIANQIIVEYQAQGFDLTLRQLYYQFVSRDIIANKQSEYKRLGSIINDARLAGMIDWDAIVDRTRELRKNAHWDSPGEIVAACAKQYQVDKWEGQEYRVEVWIEKDALVGVIEKICQKLDVPYFSCRGYTSQSEMHGAAKRLEAWSDDYDQKIVIIHLGDHDPSGKDMSRDIQDRMDLFTNQNRIIEVERIALNMDQVRKYNPPPNPAKLTDSRCAGYIKEFGNKSWELDALDPKVIANLITKTVNKYLDMDLFSKKLTLEEKHKASLLTAAKKLS